MTVHATHARWRTPCLIIAPPHESPPAAFLRGVCSKAKQNVRDEPSHIRSWNAAAGERIQLLARRCISHIDAISASRVHRAAADCVPLLIAGARVGVKV